MPSRITPWLASAVCGVLAAAAPAAAQVSGDGFLLQSPVGAFALRIGYDRPLAQGDLFRQDFKDLTLSKNDFGAIHVGTDFSFHVGQRFDVVIGSTYAGSNAKSEFRDYIDNNDLPIEQNTKLQRVTITGGGKMYLAPRGRSIGRFAWVPNRIAPYVGAGGGILWSRYEQKGDFVDFATPALNVFSATFQSDKWTPTAHVMAGTDFSLSPSLALTTEARYTYAHAALGRDFEGFDKIDLSGLSLTAGIALRF